MIIISQFGFWAQLGHVSAGIMLLWRSRRGASFWEGFTRRRLLSLAAFLGLMIVTVVTHSKLVVSIAKRQKRRCTLGRLGRSR